MGPKPSQPQTGELFGYPLRDHLNLKHPLILLGDRIQWERIDELVADQFKSRTGRPATSPRLIAGLLYCNDPVETCSGVIVTRRAQ